MSDTQYNWFFVINRDDFQAEGLVSRELSLIFDGLGPKTVLVTNAITFGITYEGIFLSVEMNDNNPFEFEGHAVHVHDNGNVFLGLPVVDD